jgi:ParB-like chromosome segregation protein Spo0J
MLEIIYLAVDSLRGYENNSRVHSAEQVDSICKSITEFGFTNPLLIDDANVLIAGHGRLMAAVKLGMDQVPCIRLSHLSENQRRAYVIADNRLALGSEWNFDKLADEIAALSAVDFNIDVLGFDASELDNLTIDEIDLPDLQDGDRQPFQAMEFKLHDSQVITINLAINKAKASGAFHPENKNSNGNALAKIAQVYYELG